MTERSRVALEHLLALAQSLVSRDADVTEWEETLDPVSRSPRVMRLVVHAQITTR